MLNENKLSNNDLALLSEVRRMAMNYPEYKDYMNAIHFLAIHKVEMSTNISQLYRLWFVEAGRTRTMGGYKIRWLRGDWYGIASDKYTTAFKKFAQAIQQSAFDSRKDSQKMSIALSQLVENRVVDYADLHLQDNTRNRKLSNMKGWRGIILAIEKNAMWTPELQEFCEALGILVATSGSGEPSRNSNEMVWDIVEERMEYGKMGDLNQPVLIAITDYDKYGHYIADSFKHHLETYGENFIFRRVAINPDDLSPEEATPEASLYELPNAWEGAIEYDGEKKYGIEMDVKEWSFYFAKILTVLQELGFNIADFDQWARQAKHAHEYKAIEDAVDQIIDENETYMELQGQITEIQKKIDRFREKIASQLEPYTEEIIEEDDFDDREDKTEFFEKDLVKCKSYENRYSSSYLTGKLAKALAEIEVEIPTKEEIEED